MPKGGRENNDGHHQAVYSSSFRSQHASDENRDAQTESHRQNLKYQSRAGGLDESHSAPPVSGGFLSLRLTQPR